LEEERRRELRLKEQGVIEGVIDGYHQLELDESSRHMTTFYGTECEMRYTRLNYGTIRECSLTFNHRNASFVCLRLNSSVLCSQKME